MAKNVKQYNLKDKTQGAAWLSLELKPNHLKPSLLLLQRLNIKELINL